MIPAEGTDMTPEAEAAAHAVDAVQQQQEATETAVGAAEVATEAAVVSAEAASHAETVAETAGAEASVEAEVAAETATAAGEATLAVASEHEGLAGEFAQFRDETRLTLQELRDTLARREEPPPSDQPVEVVVGEHPAPDGEEGKDNGKSSEKRTEHRRHRFGR